jgi:hypothetical protein
VLKRKAEPKQRRALAVQRQRADARRIVRETHLCGHTRRDARQRAQRSGLRACAKRVRGKAMSWPPHARTASKQRVFLAPRARFRVAAPAGDARRKQRLPASRLAACDAHRRAEDAAADGTDGLNSG